MPNPEFEAAKQAASSAQVALCLGTSLQITPACNLPLRTMRAGGHLVIVNLQATPKDKKADLVIHARCEVCLHQQFPDGLAPARSHTHTLTLASKCWSSPQIHP